LFVTSLNGIILTLTLLAMSVLSYLAEKIPVMGLSVIGLAVLVVTLSPLAMDYTHSSKLMARSVSLLAVCIVFMCIGQVAVLMGANSLKQRDVTIAGPFFVVMSVIVTLLPNFQVKVWSRLSSFIALLTLLVTAGLWWLQSQVNFIALNVPMLVLIAGMIIALMVRFVSRSPTTGLMAHLGWYWVSIMMIVTMASLFTQEMMSYRDQLPGFTLLCILIAFVVGSIVYVIRSRRGSKDGKR
jgi:uncharacterized membrane protein